MSMNRGRVAQSLMQGATAYEVREEVRRGRASSAVVIPPGFGRSAPRAMFGAGPRPSLTILHDPTRAAESAMARGLVTRHVMEAVAAESLGPGGVASLRESLAEVETCGRPVGRRAPRLTMLRAASGRGGPGGGSAAETSHPGGRLSVPFETKREAGHGEGDQDARRVAGTAHAFGGMAVQFVLFASIESGIGLLAERQRGLWRRLRAAPVARWTLLLAKGLSTAIVATMILAVIFLFGALAFRLRVVGSAVGFGLVCLSYAATAASFGLLIAALGKTPQAARGLSAMAVLLMVMLGGAWVPTFAFPGWLQRGHPAPADPLGRRRIRRRARPRALPGRDAADGARAGRLHGRLLDRGRGAVPLGRVLVGRAPSAVRDDRRGRRSVPALRGERPLFRLGTGILPTTTGTARVGTESATAVDDLGDDASNT